MAEHNYSFKTWDEYYYVLAKVSATTKQKRRMSGPEISAFHEACHKRIDLLLETDEKFARDYSDYLELVNDQGKTSRSAPELEKMREAKKRIDKSFEPTDDPKELAKRKVTRSSYEHRLAKNQQEEAGMRVTKNKRVEIGGKQEKGNNPNNGAKRTPLSVFVARSKGTRSI